MSDADGIASTGALVGPTDLSLVVVALFWAFQRSLIYLPSRALLVPREAALPRARDVSFQAEDGIRLAGWLLDGEKGAEVVEEIDEEEGEDDFGDRDTAWTREFFAALGRFRQGVYVNFLGGDEQPGRVREAYGESVYGRLLQVKMRYDPDNVFHHNQNIRPG